MSNARRSWFRAAAATAVVTGAISLVVAVIVARSGVGIAAADPLDSPDMHALRERLAVNPGHEALKADIRKLDEQLRAEYAADRWRVATGSWVLLAGVLVCIGSAKLAVDIGRKLDHPESTEADREAGFRLAAWSRRTTYIVGLLVVAGVAGLILTAANVLDRKLPGLTDRHELAKSQWARFRGPEGAGVCRFKDIPTTFDAKTGRNVLWKVEIDLPGNSSPVRWGNRLYITAADENDRAVICYDADTGEEIWQQAVVTAASPAEAPDVMEATGYAAPTPVVDGRRVFAIFANGDLAAFSVDGEELWSTHVGVPDNPYGHSSSLALYRGKLIVQFDQGDEEDGLSELIAYDARTGRNLWAVERKVPASWASPIVIETPAGPQIITSAGEWVIAHAVDDGKVIWKARCIGGEVGPSPIYADGIVYAVNTGEYLAAIRVDGKGDVSKTHVPWQAEEGLPDIVSPLTDGQRIYNIETSGLMTCYAAGDGKKLWEQDLNISVQASPSLVGERIYVFGDEGKVRIVAAADTFKAIGKATIGETVVASPAFGPGRIYVRGAKHLFAFGKQE